MGFQERVVHMKFAAREMLRVGIAVLVGTLLAVGVVSAEDHTWTRQPGNQYIWGGAQYCSWTSQSAAHTWGQLPPRNATNGQVWRQASANYGTRTYGYCPMDNLAKR